MTEYTEKYTLLINTYSCISTHLEHNSMACIQALSHMRHGWKDTKYASKYYAISAKIRFIAL